MSSMVDRMTMPGTDSDFAFPFGHGGTSRTDAAGPRILGILLPYLEVKDNEWRDQSPDDRRPTLPATRDGKVNVRGIVQELAGLRPADEQHFFRKPEIAGPVNILADVQGLKRIGSHALEKAEDDAARARHARDSQRYNQLAADLIEAEARIAQLTERVRQLEAELVLRTETGQVLPPEKIIDA